MGCGKEITHIDTIPRQAIDPRYRAAIGAIYWVETRTLCGGPNSPLCDKCEVLYHVLANVPPDTPKPPKQEA